MLTGWRDLALAIQDRTLITEAKLYFQFSLQYSSLHPDCLARQIPIRYRVLEGKDIGKKGREGSVARLSKNCAEITLGESIEVMTNLKMNLGDVDENLSTRGFYGKVIRKSGENKKTRVVHFTSVPPPIDAYFQAFRQLAV